MLRYVTRKFWIHHKVFLLIYLKLNNINHIKFQAWIIYIQIQEILVFVSAKTPLDVFLSPWKSADIKLYSLDNSTTQKGGVASHGVLYISLQYLDSEWNAYITMACEDSGLLCDTCILKFYFKYYEHVKLTYNYLYE